MIPQNVARHATVGRETVSTERTTEKGEESFPNYGNIKKVSIVLSLAFTTYTLTLLVVLFFDFIGYSITTSIPIVFIAAIVGGAFLCT